MDADILVIEDDAIMAELLRQGLELSGYVVQTARDGREGLRLACEGTYRAIVLDVMLPGLDGFGVASELRRGGFDTPVLMLTARAFESDLVCGLDSGADAYMTKPFSFVELRARLRVLMRRSPPPRLTLRVADLTLDTAALQACRAGQALQLSKTQLRLLEALMRSPGVVVRRSQLIAAAWDPGVDVTDNALDVAIGGLRALVDRDFAVRLIQTVRGFGYRIG